MRSQHSGMALISSMMLMGFLTIVGAALLSSTVIDSKIGMNYRVNLQRVYLAEAGIAAAQEMLRSAVEAKITASTSDAIDTLAEGISEVLKDYDGVDGLMSSSLDVDTLLDTSLTDDVRFADTVSLSAGGTTIGTYTVFLRNDPADGATSNTDTNEVVTLVSIGLIGDSQMLIEADVKKGRFPAIPSALTLGGNVPASNGFEPGDSLLFEVNGYDAAGVADVNAIGVISGTSDTTVTSDIRVDRTDSYCGIGTTFSEPCDTGANMGPDVADVSSDLASVLTTPEGLTAIVSAMESNATSTTCPTGTTGSSASPVVVVVSGDCVMNGNDTGWGALVVKGSLTMGGSVEWNGLVIVVDDTACDTDPNGGTHYTATLAGGTVINGGLFMANSVGGSLGDVCMDMQGGGNGGITYDSEKVRNAAQGLPFTPIAIWHY